VTVNFQVAFTQFHLSIYKYLVKPSIKFNLIKPALMYNYSTWT